MRPVKLSPEGLVTALCRREGVDRRGLMSLLREARFFFSREDFLSAEAECLELGVIQVTPRGFYYLG